MLQIIDNVLPISVFKSLQQKIVYNDTIPFYFMLNTAYDNENITEILKDSYSFHHQVYVTNKSSSLFPYIEMCLLSMFDKAGIECEDVIRVRIGLITNIGKPNIHKPHIDYDFSDYYTGLLYLNDSDGETIIYNELYDPNSNLKSFEYISQVLDNNLTVRQKIKPQENKLIIMKGNVFHSSSNPTDVPARYVINFNFKIKKQI